MSIAQRLKAITHIPDCQKSVTPPPPKSVKIELVARCNYKCQYCAICYRNGSSTNDMDETLFRRITREMVELGVEEIGLFYIGESFLSPDYLVRSIRYLKDVLRVPYVFLTSNASVASPKAVSQCMASGLDSLKWSCNAANPEQFSELMGVNVSLYESALYNIKKAKETRDDNGYKTGLYASSVKYNDRQLLLAEKVLNERVIPYVDEHYWLPLYTAGGQAKDKEKELGMRPIAGNTGRLDNPAEPIPCWVLFTGAHIRNDGTMTACCLDGTGNWQVGDLKTQSFMDAWHSNEFQNLRQAHLNMDITGTKCEKCVLA